MKISHIRFWRKGRLSQDQKRPDKPLNKHEMVLQEFVIDDVERRNLASMVHGVSRNKGEGVGFIENTPYQKVEVLK